MTKKKPEAAKPLGAAPTKPLTKADKLKRLQYMASKMIPKAQRKAFIEQGRMAIDRQEAEDKLAVNTKAVFESVKKVLDAHGVTTAHIIIKMPISKAEAALGLKGWAATAKVKDNTTLELLGVLSNSAHTLSARGLGRIHF